MAKRKLPPGVSYRGKTKDGQPKHQGKVRAKGYNLNQLFVGAESDLEAGRWVVETKAAIRGDEYKDLKREKGTRLIDLIDRYEREVSPTKKGTKQERSMFNILRGQEWALYPVRSVRKIHISTFRNDREKAGLAPSTVNNPVNLLSAVFKHAASEWGFEIDNPVTGVKRVPQGDARDVQFVMSDLGDFLAECEESASGYWWLKYVVKLQLLTAMRQGEVRRLRWRDLKKEDDGYAWHLPETKNGTSRDVPLLPEAEELVFELKKIAPKRKDGYVFGNPNLPASEGGFSTNLVTLAHRNAAIRSGYRDAEDIEEEIEDDELDHDEVAIGAVLGTASDGKEKVELKGKLTNHDLRHIAITMLAKFYPNILELQEVTGHKTLSQLQRYYNVSRGEKVSKLKRGQRDHNRKLEEDRKAREQEAAAREREAADHEARLRAAEEEIRRMKLARDAAEEMARFFQLRDLRNQPKSAARDNKVAELEDATRRFHEEYPDAPRSADLVMDERLEFEQEQQEGLEEMNRRIAEKEEERRRYGFDPDQPDLQDPND